MVDWRIRSAPQAYVLSRDDGCYGDGGGDCDVDGHGDGGGHGDDDGGGCQHGSFRCPFSLACEAQRRHCGGVLQQTPVRHKGEQISVVRVRWAGWNKLNKHKRIMNEEILKSLGQAMIGYDRGYA